MDMYKYCESITKKNNIDLFRLFYTLPYEKSSALFAFYAFYKTVDNSIDEHNDVHELDNINDHLKNLYQGLYVNDTLFQALKDSLKRYPNSIVHFQNIIKAVRNDYYHNFIRTEAELDEYCLNVSGSIQLLYTPVFASKNYKEHRQLLEIIAKNIGYAIQITNILRDVGEDIKNDRIYLTDEMLNKHGASPRDIINGVITIEYINVIKEYIEKAKESYNVLYDNIELYDEDSRAVLLTAVKNYENILDRIIANKYDNFNIKSKVLYVSKIFNFIRFKIKYH
ncbi:MAG: phytoene/squalene synthase family protein [Candidatus Izemoplasma sp.]